MDQVNLLNIVLIVLPSLRRSPASHDHTRKRENRMLRGRQIGMLRNMQSSFSLHAHAQEPPHQNNAPKNVQQPNEF